MIFKRLFLVCFLLLLSSLVKAELIDLGSLEIEGELRRPQLEYQSSSQSSMNALLKVLKDNMVQFQAGVMNQTIKTAEQKYKLLSVETMKYDIKENKLNDIEKRLLAD